MDRAFSAERTAARVDRALAMQTAMLAAHEAAGAAGDAADGLSRVLTALCCHAGATHAALLATAPQVRRLAAVGPTESAPVEVVRLAHEHRLAGLGEPGPAEFGPDDLKAAGVRSLVGRAVRVPVAGRVPAALLLTRSDAADFAPHHAEIAAWAGRFLGELLPRVSATAAVRRKASRDPLTGLANRGTFEDRLEELALDARSGGDDLTLLMCDLDHFKAVNDAHGHQVGDAVLVAAADAFRAVLADCRREDRALPARFGGEELCVLLAGFGRAGGGPRRRAAAGGGGADRRGIRRPAAGRDGLDRLRRPGRGNGAGRRGDARRPRRRRGRRPLRRQTRRAGPGRVGRRRRGAGAGDPGRRLGDRPTPA